MDKPVLDSNISSPPTEKSNLKKKRDLKRFGLLLQISGFFFLLTLVLLLFYFKNRAAPLFVEKLWKPGLFLCLFIYLVGRVLIFLSSYRKKIE